jgi:hypothetical protein
MSLFIMPCVAWRVLKGRLKLSRLQRPPANLDLQMQTTETKPAIFGMANSRDISGWVTAELGNRVTRLGKRRNLSRIFGVALKRLTTAVFLVLAPTWGWAEETGGAVHNDIEALEAKVATLQAIVAAQQAQISSLQSQLTAIQSNPALALGPFVSVDPSSENEVVGPNITFRGANIHIVSGSGFTDDNDNPTGLGNLIIGYDEPPGNLNRTERGGSHNLVIGRYNRFTQAAFGSLVAGTLNTISNRETSVTGGANNTASGLFASVSGGESNTASGEQASVSGGVSNVACGSADSISGGDANTASGTQASVSGGTSNNASGNRSSISGGDGNTASGNEASICGGAGNTASGSATMVIGGQIVNDRVDGSIRPQPPFTP